MASQNPNSSTDLTFNFNSTEKKPEKAPIHTKLDHSDLNFLKNYIDTEKYRLEQVKEVKKIISEGGFEELKARVIGSFVQGFPGKDRKDIETDREVFDDETSSRRPKFPPGLFTAPGLSRFTDTSRLPNLGGLNKSPSLGKDLSPEKFPIAEIKRPIFNFRTPSVSLQELSKRASQKKKEQEKKRMSYLEQMQQMEREKRMRLTTQPKKGLTRPIKIEPPPKVIRTLAPNQFMLFR